MKAYDACPKCQTIDRSKEWEQGISKKPYYVCECDECNNIYYQTYRGQDSKEANPSQDIEDNKDKVHIKSIEITPEKRDPVPIKGNQRIDYLESQCIQLSNDHDPFIPPNVLLVPPIKRGKDTTSQARL